MTRRGFLLAQVMVMSTLALGLALATFSRTSEQMHRLRRTLSAEQTALMLDALEQLTAGQSDQVTLEVPGWPVLRATPGPAGWTLEARPAGGALATRALTGMVRP